MLKVDDILKLQQLEFYYKYLYNDLPVYLQNWRIIFSYDIHNYDTQIHPLAAHMTKLKKFTKEENHDFSAFKFNLNTGHGNLDINYNIGDTILGTTVKEKDSGITISADMKVSEQCGIAASKGNQILGLTRRTITYKEKS